MSKSCWLSWPKAATVFGGVLFAGMPAGSANADRVMLLTGETMEVTNLAVTDSTVRFDHPVLGSVELSRDQVRGVETARERGRFEEAAALGAIQDEAMAEPEPASEWEGSVTLAFSGTSGNSESVGFVGLADVKRETDRMITSLDTGYFFASSGGDRSENRFTLGGVHDWLFPDSRWSIFVDGRYDLDEFQSWDYRISSHVGAGYHLVDEANYQARLRGGIGFVKEFNSANDDVRPEALFGVEGEWKISDKQSLTYDATIYPDLDDAGEFRSIENLAWEVLLDEATNMSLSAGVQHEHQSQVSAGRDKDDFRVYAGLNFSF